MTYVLIIMLAYGGNAAAVSMNDFSSKESCEIAGELAIKNKPILVFAKYVCVEK